MPPSTERVTRRDLRRWPLPDPGDSKYSRGSVLVVGGASRSPGAAMLAGRAALRAGSGRLTLAVGESVAPHVAVAVPEAAVVPLAEDRSGHVDGTRIDSARDAIVGADAVLIGPGLDDIQQAEELIMRLPSLLAPDTTVVLDAFALGALRGHPDLLRESSSVILTPNKEEAAILLGRDVDDPGRAAAEIADRFDAVVICYGAVAAPGGRLWRVRPGAAGLGTSGSGDVAAGIAVGLAARKAQPEQAAVWSAHLHAVAGDRASQRIGFLGYLASELLDEIPREMAAIERRH